MMLELIGNAEPDCPVSFQNLKQQLILPAHARFISNLLQAIIRQHLSKMR